MEASRRTTQPENVWEPQPYFQKRIDRSGLLSAMRHIAALSIAFCIFAGGPGAHGQSPVTFFKDTFEQMLRNDPEYATGVGRHDYDDRWTDWLKAARDERRRFFEQRLAQLDSAPVGNSSQDLLTKRVVRYDFESRLEAWELDTHLLRVGQLFGFHNVVYDVIDRMPARNVHDYENIIARLRALPTYVDQNITILDESINSGMMQSRIVTELVIQQIETQLKQDAEHTELLKNFRAFPTAVPQTEQVRLRREAQDAYNQKFLPSWQKLHDYMADSYLLHVRTGDSVSSMKGGRAAYKILIHRLTTTTMSPAEIHKLGETGGRADPNSDDGRPQGKRIPGFHSRFPEEAGRGSIPALPFQGRNAGELPQYRKDRRARTAQPVSRSRPSSTEFAPSRPIAKPPLRQMPKVLPLTFPRPDGSI